MQSFESEESSLLTMSGLDSICLEDDNNIEGNLWRLVQDNQVEHLAINYEFLANAM